MSAVGRRGTGPWPSTNTDSVVTAWLMSRLSQVEAEERGGMARWLLDHVSGQGKGARLVADMRWHESQLDRLAVMAERLNEGEPIQHVLGESWFDGLRLEVSPSVLIPRPETEELVAAMADKVAALEGPVRVADWCTGSGCMALAMKRRHPHAEVVGYEWSMDALEVARSNAQVTGMEVQWRHADALHAEQPDTPFSAVMSNPPYIPAAERQTMHPRVTEHEPGMALFVPDDDPLVFYRAIASWCAQGALVHGGWIGLECHTAKAQDVARLLEAQKGWEDVDILHDLQGLPRHVVARRALP